MTEQEVRRYLRQMKEEDSERAFHSFYNLCYDRLFRIALSLIQICEPTRAYDLSYAVFF